MAAVALSDQYLPDRSLPGKAMDLLDEAAAQVALRRLDQQPPGLRDQEEAIAAVRADKEAASTAQDFGKALALRDEETRMLAELTKQREKWRIRLATVTEADIIEALEAITITAPANIISEQPKAAPAPFRAAAMADDDREIWAMS